jgi:catechol 2,3-dioxygenase-like lactoylglutathione lyase family enzyme
MLPAPGFHHLHLNANDPDAAIDFYAKQFPTSSQARWGGLPALTAPNNVLILFTKVPTAPATSPQTAIWHFGWHVTDSRARLEAYQGRLDVELLPLYTGDGGRYGPHQQRHVAGHGRRARPDAGADHRRQDQRYAADSHRRLCI